MAVRSFLVLPSLPSLCRWRGFSCPSPLLCFVCVFIHAGLCFLGILRCILHALLAGLLIKLCLRAISSDIYQMSSFLNSSVPPVSSQHLPKMISCFLLSRKMEYDIKGYVVWKITDKVYIPEGDKVMILMLQPLSGINLWWLLFTNLR